jgi:hypothetical protein
VFRTLLFEEEMGVDGWSEKIWFYVFLSELVEKRKKKKSENNNGENWTAELTGRPGRLNRAAPPPPRQD